MLIQMLKWYNPTIPNNNISCFTEVRFLCLHEVSTNFPNNI
nr:MAG TPA: hypothetical protein [Caudoviricetes sp.]